MDTNSISSGSSNYLQFTLADQMMNKGAQGSSAQSPAKGQLSAFAQMFSDSSTSAASQSSNPSQLLSQMVSSFQTNSIQNQGQAFDPISIGQ
jgi:hypothetical protein